ncbi:hypothetical protein GOV09_02365 [Candidatus Woesearchaeota archaeon]|nr:hypothetical protein [Candidatus Woesearchaeota archaeon]
MRVHKFGILLARSLLSMFLFSLIFISITDFNSDAVLGGLFGDIFEYADAQAQNHATGQLEEICDDFLIGNKKDLPEVRKICENQELIDQMEQNCFTYYGLRAKKETERNPDLEESCLGIMAGQFRAQCESITSVQEINVSSFASVCETHRNNLISDRDFFQNFILASVPFQKSLPVNQFIIPIALIVLTLIGILLLLHKERNSQLMFTLGRVIFNVGMIAMAAFLVVFIFNQVRPPDTTFILEAIGAEPSQDFVKRALPLLFPLVIARIFTMNFLIIGGILAFVGLMIKIKFKKGKI